MAGLAFILDLAIGPAGGSSWLPSSISKVVHSTAFLSPAVVAAFAAAGVTFSPLGQHGWAKNDFSFRDWSGNTVYCDASIYADNLKWEPRFATYEEYRRANKTYDVELKPLLSAFTPRPLALTVLRALLINFGPLLENFMQADEDDMEDYAERPLPPDSAVLLKRSGTHILREVSISSTRRVLERVVVHYVSRRAAWKLLKDAPKSAQRKARRNLSKIELTAGVCRTTFRAHTLGVAANWLVQEVLDIYCAINILFFDTKKRKVEAKDDVLKRLARRTAGNTLKAGASLVLASIGAGIGVLIEPSTGTWIGLVVGDLAGATLVGVWFDSLVENIP